MNTNLFRIWRQSAVWGLLAWFAAGDVLAQQAGALEDIVVTSRRIEESLQQTPIAVTALSAEALEERAVARVDQAIEFIPNVSVGVGQNGGSNGFYYIRGIGVNDFTASFDAPVGVYIDGVYLGKTTGNTFDLLDIDRIEVLRGPQGTLFGRNTSGGAISVVSKRPSGEFNGRASVLAGDRNRLEGKLELDFPIVDTLAGRFSFMHREQDGWVDRLLDGQTLGDVDTNLARGMIEWRPNESFSFLLSADWQSSDNTSTPQLTTDIAFPNATPCPPFCIPFPDDIEQDLSPSFDKTWQGVTPPTFDLDIWGVAGTIEWDIGPVTLKSITAYRDVEQLTFADFDVTSYWVYDQNLPTQTEQFSQEFQFSGNLFQDRADWLLGFFYFDEETDETNNIGFGSTGPGGVLACPVCIPLGPGISLPVIPLVVDPPTRGDYRFRIQANQNILPSIESYAVFGHVNYRFNDQWSINAGLRWSKDEKTQGYRFTTTNTIPNHPFYAIGVNPDFSEDVSDEWDTVDPRVGVEYQPTDDLMFYVSYAEGFRTGGFNSRPLPGQPLTAFEPDEVATYEFGMKSEWVDNRVRLNAALFYSEYDDIQVQITRAGFFDIANAGEATLQGFELELFAVPVDSIQLNAAIGYLDAEYDSILPEAEAVGVLLENELPMTPELTYSLGAQYNMLVRNIGDFSFRADYSFTDERYSFANNLPGNLLEDYFLLNLRASWTLPGDQWEFSVYGYNVTDEEYLTWAEDVRESTPPLGTWIQDPSRPREWGGQVLFRF